MSARVTVFRHQRPARPGQALAWLSGLLLTVTLAQTGLQGYGEYGNGTAAAWKSMLDQARPLDTDDKLNSVNQFFNRRLRFTTDQMAWGRPDYWATPLEFMLQGQGDCEDFAIAKYVSLLKLGVPSDRLRLIYVRARFGSASSGNSEAHMVLGYYSDPTGEPRILDNLVNSIRPATARTDLTPIFSFNSQGLWVPGSAKPAAPDPTARLSRWRNLLDRMGAEGLQL
jgi:predicted transglutaminase-like cysteine proteinase